jgi:hypothetical protein
MKEYIADHCHVSMDKAIAAERFPLWKRSCETICHSNYFNALKSARRMNMVKVLESKVINYATRRCLLWALII